MGDSVSPPKIRGRWCMFVLYPESQSDVISYVQSNFSCAWALHDKDVYTQSSYDRWVSNHDGQPPDWNSGDLKKAHVHFVCKFSNARYFHAIAKELGVADSTIRKVNNPYKAYVYLWHMLDPEKAQYKKDIVGTHDFDEPSEHVGMSASEDDAVQLLLEMPRFDTFNEMCRWVYEQGCWATFKSSYSMWRDIFLEQRHKCSQATASLNDGANQMKRRTTGMKLPDDFPTPFEE